MMIQNLRLGGAAIALLALAACNKKPAEESFPEPRLSESPDAEPTGQVSIIRDDVEVDRELPLLEPLKQRISFDEGGSKLSDAALAELKIVLESRQMEAGGLITLRGHTDSAGFDEANLRASTRRAEAVRDWLTGKGIDESRIKVIAIGEQNPARPNAKPDGTPDEEGRAFNRRVVLEIALPPEVAARRTEEQPQSLIEQVVAED